MSSEISALVIVEPVIPRVALVRQFNKKAYKAPSQEVKPLRSWPRPSNAPLTFDLFPYRLKAVWSSVRSLN